MCRGSDTGAALTRAARDRWQGRDRQPCHRSDKARRVGGVSECA